MRIPRLCVVTSLIFSRSREVQTLESLVIAADSLDSTVIQVSCSSLLLLKSLSLGSRHGGMSVPPLNRSSLPRVRPNLLIQSLIHEPDVWPIYILVWTVYRRLGWPAVGAAVLAHPEGLPSGLPIPQTWTGIAISIIRKSSRYIEVPRTIRFQAYVVLIRVWWTDLGRGLVR